MSEKAKPTEERTTAWAVRQIEESLRGLQFGQVTGIVQDGVVVQVERTEKRRLQRRSQAAKAHP